MSKNIRIAKGLDIKLIGAAQKTTSKAASSNTYSLRLSDFHGITPKMLVKEGAELKAGEPIFYNKLAEQMKFVSPVSGELVEIQRGARRRILTLKILADKEQQFVEHGAVNPAQADTAAVKAALLESGCWPFIKQRPYDVIADPNRVPKAIFVSGINSAPLSADLEYILEGKQEELGLALAGLKKLTPGSVHVSVRDKKKSVFTGIEGISLHQVKGPHPAGLISTQINKINPINKGEVVWTVSAWDLVVIGEFFKTGRFNADRLVALGGSMIKEPKYYTTKIGAELSTMLYASGVKDTNFRLINGDVLTGTQTDPEGYLGYYNSAVTAIPEGDDYEFFGWNKPVFNKISSTRALTFSWMNSKKEYDLDTNTNGEHRAFVVTGTYERVFPLDIYPLQLLKACMVKDLDEMENLGLYEVAPEDFALTEFICISKQPHQQIIREGLDLMHEEIG